MAINFNLLRPTGPANLAEGLMQGQEQQNALMQQQQQRQLGEIQLRNALREEQNALAEAEAARGAMSLEDLAGRYRKAGLGKQALSTEAALAKQRTDKLTAAKTQTELLKSSAARIMSNPAAAVQELTRYQQLTGVDMSDDISQVQKLATPEAIKEWAAGHALDADKLLLQFKEFQTPGGGKQIGTYNPVTGKFTSSQELVPTMTPYEKGHLAVQQGQLKVAQDRLAKEGAGLDPAENAAISKAIIEGRLDPNRVNGRNAKILATTLLANPEANVLELGVSAAGATAAERSLAGQTAKMSTAANEANKMVGVVRGLSDKVDRTEFPTLNAISNAVAKGTGNKEIVQLNTSINALVNSYARAISPTGAPTVSDKNHAREIINSAYSQGQLGAILDVMQQEMAISREAAGTASTELKASREAARGRPAAAAATAGRPSGVGADWTFMTDAKGNKAWVSPDQKNFVEVK